MDLAVLNLCNIITRANCTPQPNVEWNAKSVHCLMPAVVNNTICQVITLVQYQREIVMRTIKRVKENLAISNFFLEFGYRFEPCVIVRRLV